MYLFFLYLQALVISDLCFKQLKQVQVSIGEKMLVGLATGTAVYLTPLPPPPVPKVSAGNSWTDEHKLAEIQKLLQDTVKKNRELYELKSVPVSITKKFSNYYIVYYIMH